MIKANATIYAGGKSSKLWFQDATSADCGKTMYDNRGTDTYRDIAYSTKSLVGLCWMARNLDLPGGTILTSGDTNLVDGFTLPASSTAGFNSYNTDYVYNSNNTSCSYGSPCYSYYSFYTATAHWGTDSVGYGQWSDTDVCPKGWRLPTLAEYNELRSIYTTGALLMDNWSAVYSSYYYDGAIVNGAHGAYWSSTTNMYENRNAYSLYAYNGGTSTDSSASAKYFGLAIRCVAKS